MSVQDKKIFSVRDFIQTIVFVGTMMTLYFKLDSRITELATIRTADDKVMSARVEVLEADNSLTKNRVNEFDKRLIQIEAVIPDRVKFKTK